MNSNMKDNIDIQVIMLRDNLRRTIVDSPLPITVKSMIVSEIVSEVRADEEHALGILLNAKGSENYGYDFGRSEKETLSGTDANLLSGQRFIQSGNRESDRDTAE